MRFLTLLWLSCITASALPTDRQERLKLTKAASMSSHDSDHQVVPGDSPVFYIGDPKNDLLSIESLDLLPNPPIDDMTVRLRGNIKSDIGDKVRIKLTVALNGTVGPIFESDLFSQLEVTQNGTSVCSLKSGPVEMSYSVVIPYWWLKKGNYTVHTEIKTSDDERMTDFEGTVWVNGEAEDGDPWT